MEAAPEIDWVGINLYRNKEDYWNAVQQTCFLVGSTRLPFVPEFGCGIWSHYPLTPTPDEQELITLATLMHGLKAFNLYMLVERERWQGSAITRHGALRPDYADFYRRLTTFLQKYHFWRFERARAVLVLRNYDLGRHVAVASALDYAHCDLYGLPHELFTEDMPLKLCWDAAAEADEHHDDTWFGMLRRALHEHGGDYDMADTHVADERLAQYPITFLQATDFMKLDDQRRMLAYVAAGSTLIVGPGLPYTDPTLRHAGPLAQQLAAPGDIAIGEGRLIWASANDLAQLVSSRVPAAAFRCDDPAIDVAVLQHAGQTLIYAANPTADVITTTLRFAGKRSLQAVWRGDATCSGDGGVEIVLPPYSAQIWEARPNND